MKKYIFFCVAILELLALSVNAQVYDRKSVRSGENLSDYAYYLFPSFSDGIMKSKDGSKSESKMNFNMLYCQMQFIGPNGDTLNIAKPEDIDSVRLNNNSFFYNKGYFEIIEDFDSVKLVVLRKVSYEPVKIGAMGQPSHATSIDSYESLLVDDRAESKKLTLNQDLDIVLISTYFLMRGNGDMVTANKKNFLDFFAGGKQNIESYLKSQKTDFKK